MAEFSIVITCFNHRAFIADAILSALNQTCAPKEIIVVDDASRDGSPQVLDAFADRVIVIKNVTNVGANEARNLGARRATGDYLVFLDGDDLFRQEAIAIYDHLADASRPVLILSLLSFFDNEIPSMNVPAGEPIRFAEYPRLMLKDRPYASSASAIVVDRKAFLAAGGWTEVFPCEDTDLFLRVAAKGSSIHILAPETALKRGHASNYSRNILAMTSGIFKVLVSERKGNYRQGESLYARYCFIGGPCFFWVKECLSIGEPGTAIRLAVVSLPMILAAIFHKLGVALKGRSVVQTKTLTTK